MKYIKHIVIASILISFYSCGNLIKDPADSTSSNPETSAPTLIPLPITDGYTFIPSTNNYFFKNTSGGGFKITQVYSHPQSSTTFAGVTSDGEYIYTLVNNSKAFYGSYIINKFNLDGSSFQSCPWYGDGFTYYGIAVENETVFLKRSNYNLKVVKYNFSSCQYTSLISITTNTDADGYSYSGYDNKITVAGGLFYFTFTNNGKTRIKSYSPTTFTFQNYAESQALGQEPLKYDAPYVMAANSLWTVRPCYALYGPLCFWRLDRSANSISYGYLPKDYFPELSQDYAGTGTLIRGNSNSEYIYALLIGDEIHFYKIDVSKF